MTKQTYSEFIAEDRRLSILLILKECARYSANEHLISQGLDNCGHYVAADQLYADLVMLEEKRVLNLSEIGDMTIATLTRLGQDVAEGRTVIEGIKRPNAGA